MNLSLWGIRNPLPAALTFVAQAPGRALVRHAPLAPLVAPLDTMTGNQPALTIVVAAQAESVQDWLEQGQPVQQRPTLAFTSAGACACACACACASANASTCDSTCACAYAASFSLARTSSLA